MSTCLSGSRRPSAGAAEPIRPFDYPRVTSLTALGVLGATVVYGAIHQRSRKPDRTFALVTVGVLLVSFLPDIAVHPGMAGATTEAIAVLMALHVTTAGIAYGVLTRR